ncbi:hypothetical protein GLOTRDRAFT_137938 [Gloeophyllum trabeum ATCC 11539]|uniref:G-protein coupled receptors family 1 profile domain-containing protein n=1 Tax=Gloeophyllum trabeum (strain ATCC 11539 / FP-39264 / Madison 617) TaxID=670483 RepID=S7Q7X8_GLOTA|nr:uncharacterized protein GLOTRDRAFT_137938 [Gloeophyllum trabeum ATCC 11539]EPQ56091.1 hypothetical protein GLOTRDRAFT_137938 [Gloeophyllum trabeum ATCC 11539]
MSNSSFTWSPDKQRVVVWTAVVPTIFSLVSAIVVLALALVVWRSPKTRPPPGRQTLRMLLWVQLMSLAYSGTYLGEVLITGPTKWCDAIIIIALFSNNFINFMIMLIPLHLQLVLVHSVRTDGFVHWYLVISLAASTMTALPGCITRIWGWDPETLICWISATNPRSRTAWEVGASYAWFVISTAVASVSTIVVLAHLVKHARSKVVRCEVTLGNSVSAGNANASSRRRHRGTSVVGNASIARRAAWRILFYPVVLVVVNTIAVAADFLVTRDGGISAYGTYAVWVASGAMYGFLPGAYAAIILFIDPSFSSALRTLFASQKRESLDSLEMGSRAPRT